MWKNKNVEKNTKKYGKLKYDLCLKQNMTNLKFMNNMENMKNVKI